MGQSGSSAGSSSSLRSPLSHDSAHEAVPAHLLPSGLVSQLAQPTVHGLWTLIHSRSADHDYITVFEAPEPPAAASAATPQDRARQTAAQRLRRLRHPRLVKLEWEQRQAGTCSLVTEPVLPLQMQLSSQVGPPAATTHGPSAACPCLDMRHGVLIEWTLCPVARILLLFSLHH